MKMFYLLIKGIILRFKIMIGLKGYIHDEYVIPLYIIGFLLSYIGALTCLSVGWWIYEWAILGQLNQNRGDTVTYVPHCGFVPHVFKERIEESINIYKLNMENCYKQPLALSMQFCESTLLVLYAILITNQIQPEALLNKGFLFLINC